MAEKDAEEEEDDAPDSEEPASEEPASEATAKEVAKEAEPDKPVPKSVEWGIAIAMMVVLVGFLLLMIHFMRSARSAVM